MPFSDPSKTLGLAVGVVFLLYVLSRQAAKDRRNATAFASDYSATRAALDKPSSSGGLVLVGTLALFVLTFSGGSLANVAVVVGVLLVHELGHYAAMRLFGYRDVRIFFVPFLGAATSGRQAGAAPWKEGVVLLAGPLPGIVLGLSLALFVPMHDPVVRHAVLSLLLINGLNLLPLAGLDGGRLLQRVIFARQRHLEVAFLLVTGAALTFVAVRLSSWALGAFAALGVVTLPRRNRLLAAAHDLRPDLEGAIDAASLDEDRSRRLFDAAARVVGPRAPFQPGIVAATMEAMVDAVRPSPRALPSLALLGAWLGGGLLTGLGAIASAGRHVLPVAWTDHALPEARLVVMMPADARSALPRGFAEGVAGVEGLFATGPRGFYNVSVWTLAPGDAEKHAEIIAAAWRGSLVAALGEQDAPIDKQPTTSAVGAGERATRNAGKSICEARLFELPPRLVRLQSCAPADSPDRERFLASLRPVN